MQTITKILILASLFLVVFLAPIVSASVSVGSGDTYQFVLKWGERGSGDSQFESPNGVAIDSGGYVYVADANNHRIQKFDSDGNFEAEWGSQQRTGDGDFQWPQDVAVDSGGYVYVADTWNHRIQKFDSDGMFLTQWGSNGSGDGQFNKPYGIAVDSEGNVYVAETWNHRIQKFAFAAGGAEVISAEAKVCWHHDDLHLDGKLYLPEGIWMDSLPPVGGAVITLAGVEVADQNIEFEIKGKKDKWEYKDKKNLYGSIKEFRIDWKEAKFDYKGDDKFHMHTHSIGEAETTLCIHTGDISGAFTVTIGETTIEYDEYGNLATNVPYDPQKDDNTHVHFSLPFQLISDMAIEVSGAIEVTINVADYYKEGYAKFKLVSIFDSGLIPDGSGALPDKLEYVISLGDGVDMISGSDLISSWTKKDDKHWEYK